MNLHRALDKLADGSEPRSEAEERDLGGHFGCLQDCPLIGGLVVSARIWLNCYMHDHLLVLRQPCNNRMIFRQCQPRNRQTTCTAR